jgi:2-oxoglutarate ferredoxin oxidoreductase subunit alpha
MSIDITIKIGGEAGQGIQTVGDLLSLVCQKTGLYVMAINDFESRIRGGHSFMQLRISDHPIRAPHHQVHLLVALDERTYNLHKNELADGGLVLMEGTGQAAGSALQIPITELAKQAGGKITANIVAAGACLSLLGAPFEIYKNVLTDHFAKKGPEAIEKNLKAATLGYEAVKGASFQWAFEWKPESSKGKLIDGAKATALGALASDCRMAAFYPMSPATNILSHLEMFSDYFPLVVEQAEDEIAAVNMVIGASFAGVRAMTATSGGGFSLMVEALGLAAISENPIVIVNAQRPGPSTGLPTRTAQPDLLFSIYASQDEFPRFIFAPATPTESYEVMMRAFHLAEKYQVPAIILTDQYLTDSIFMTEKPLKAPEKVERFIVADKDLENPSDYKRYALTPSGISPRAIPCMGKALVIGASSEHGEYGHGSEAAANRINMVNKRNGKITAMMTEMNPPKACHGDSETLIVSWGSTEGAAAEAVDMLRKDGMNVGCLNFTDIWPLPIDSTIKALSNAKRFFVVEGNQSAQFATLIRQQTGLTHSGTVLKYDGRPFYPIDIADGVKKLMR